MSAKPRMQTQVLLQEPDCEEGHGWNSDISNVAEGWKADLSDHSIAL